LKNESENDALNVLYKSPHTVTISAKEILVLQNCKKNTVKIEKWCTKCERMQNGFNCTLENKTFDV